MDNEKNNNVEEKIEENLGDVKEDVVVENNPSPKKNGNGLLIIAIIFLSILVGVGATIGIISLFNKGENNGGSTSPKNLKSEYRLQGNGLEKFDLYFLKIENEKVNKIYSPLSIKYALEMLNEGANGNTKAQIDAIIGDYEARSYTNSSNMSFANALFIRDTFASAIKEDYKNKLINKYNAEVIVDPFESANRINKWVKDKTLNLLDNLVYDVSDLDFALINALAIDMEWEHKFFKPINSYVDYSHEILKTDKNVGIGWLAPLEVGILDFEDVNEKVSGMRIDASFNKYDIIKELGEENIRKTVGDEYKKYMQENPTYGCYEVESCGGKKYEELTEEEIEVVVKAYLDTYIEEISKNYKKYGYNTDFSLYTDDKVRVFAKDLKEYNGTTLQYIGIMPIEESLDSYIENVSAEEVNRIISNLKELKLDSFKEGYFTRITGFIPKFDFEYELDLKADLNKLGVVDVFDGSKADLTNIVSSKGAYIETAKHKANIEFTQDGIKAAAATFEGGAGAGGMFDYLFEVPTEVIDLTFDRPYMFIIRDKSTGEVLI